MLMLHRSRKRLTYYYNLCHAGVFYNIETRLTTGNREYLLNVLIKCPSMFQNVNSSWCNHPWVFHSSEWCGIKGGLVELWFDYTVTM